MQLTVLTYNIHGGVGIDGVLDLDRLAAVIADSGAELVALQEVDRYRREQSGRAGSTTCGAVVASARSRHACCRHRRRITPLCS